MRQGATNKPLTFNSAHAIPAQQAAPYFGLDGRQGRDFEQPVASMRADTPIADALGRWRHGRDGFDPLKAGRPQPFLGLPPHSMDDRLCAGSADSRVPRRVDLMPAGESRR
jgi:hypothetical protein